MFVLLLAAGAAVAARNLVPFQLSISDQSPLVQFSATGPTGWNSSFSRSSWATYTQGQAGMGSSWHSINTSDWGSYARPNFSISISASDIIVMGDVNGSPPADNSINATITEYPQAETSTGTGPSSGGNTTGVPASQGVKLAPGQLARLSNLDENKPFSVGFTITDALPGVYNVRGFVVTTGLLSDAETFDKVPQSTDSFVVDGKANPEFKVDGSAWTVNTSTIYDDSTARNVTELFCPQGDQNANVTISVPPRTAFALVNGTVGPDRSVANYHWTPAPPNVSLMDLPGEDTSTPWVSGQVLHAQRLDPDVNYVLNVTQSRLGSVHLDKVTFYSANATEAPDNGQTPVGTIVGGVLGGVGGAFLLAILGFYLCFWRPRKHREREAEAALERNNAGFIPFGTNDGDGGQEPLMQETDAGSVVLPPQYNPEWGAASGSVQGTSGSHISTMNKSHLSLQASDSKSATGVLTPLAPWKEPYVNRTYAQEAAPPSAVHTPTDARGPLARLPPGAAPV
ncbi:hypothetical protein CcaverHIS631_0112960 [Cutaneotrichosporon cavernicola]|nr:hypothetical protein CcaverHIS631_0112960 [Cutaneotrichosporon cavernicola]BEJ04119.1 hypothetical protein CcaverHIS641_0112940 [Cutaneotrichosporon cavernicola]